jgi:uncharacterized protein with FMN-binding domain
MTPLQKKNALATLAILSLAPSIAGCATEEPVAAVTGPYSNGDYDATADYQSPNGTETIDVELTLENDVITDITVTGKSVDPSPEVLRFQGEFEAGIADVVTGQNIDELNVHRVGGSSLTSSGFNEAIERIKIKAKAA